MLTTFSHREFKILLTFKIHSNSIVLEFEQSVAFSDAAWIKSLDWMWHGDVLGACRLPICNIFTSASQSTSAPSLSHLKTHWVVAADSPERDFAIKSKHSSGKARCSSNGTLVTRDWLISSANDKRWVFFIRKDTMGFWPDDLEPRQGLFTLFEAGEYLVESFCPLCLEFKDLVILVSSSSKQAEALHL